jgi:SAM-dependent methyltransferase
VSGRESDEWFPLEPEEHEAQVHAVLSLLGPAPKRVIDLGAGGGRLAGPLVRAGHEVLAIDSDPDAIAECERLGACARRADLRDPEASLGFGDGATADAAILLGGTLMEFVDPLEAVALLRRMRAVVRPAGWLAVDGSLVEVWDDVGEGAWATGVSEDGRWQMIWAPGDSVVALRREGRVDPDDWEIREDDRLLRLWSRGDLALLAEASGWGAPEPVDFRTLLRLERPASAE